MPRKLTAKSDPVVVVRKAGRPKAHKAQPLTRRQELFVKELVSKDGQITMQQAAINAGYPASSAHTRAYELTNPHMSPHVVSQIQAYRTELDQKYGVNYQRHLRDLQTIRDVAMTNGAYSAAVQAEYRRGMAQGDIYVSKSEIRHGSIDSMTREEVLSALKEIKHSYAPVTIEAVATRGGNAQNRNKARKRLLETDEKRTDEKSEEADSDTS